MAAKYGSILFPTLDTARYGENRRYRKLILPKLLKSYANDNRLRDQKQKRAYEIFLRWADLESSGKLRRKKETTLEGEFLTEVFGEALGYTLFRENQSQWDIEQKFTVNGGQADAAIGQFQHNHKISPRVLIELKGPKVNIDRDRSNGRTAVQQCWDYLNEVPECPWGLVCNYVSFRLYHRNHTPRSYTHYALQDLRNQTTFEEFYYLFNHHGFLPETSGQTPRADRLLEESNQRQRDVGDILYRDYHLNRVRLIDHLISSVHHKTLDQAIGITQKLLDRIIFIAFCEDRGLLPANILRDVYNDIPVVSRVTNPRWRNFLELFRAVDVGNKRAEISGYNGGLFREDPEVDSLELDDDWTDFFRTIGTYDFRDEVNVDVLGHLFERSINDIDKIRLGGLFEKGISTQPISKMDKSAERKRQGIYYTPPDFTEFITYHTMTQLIADRFAMVAQTQKIELDELGTKKPTPARAKLWQSCLDVLRNLKVVDPACGSGAFLISAYDVMEEQYQNVIDHIIFHQGKDAEALCAKIPLWILNENLYGVDLSPEAVEISQLALWIRSAQKGKTLENLAENIVCGNSLISDPQVNPLAMQWTEVFPAVFSGEQPGFDCVIGNPPWERIKLQEREFFDGVRGDIATAVNAATRRQRIEKLKVDDPPLYEKYMQAKETAEKTLDYVRQSKRYPMTAKGDINTYAIFAELAHTLVNTQGRVGILVPSGIATDHTTRKFFGHLVDTQRLRGLYDFENKAPVFPDVHRSFKFCVLLYGGSETTCEVADFSFFAHCMEDLEDPQRHISLTAKDFRQLNPNTHTCPIFRNRRDAELTKAIYNRIPVLIDKSRKQGGNPWGIKFLRMFDQTNDAELFTTAEQLKQKKFKRDGSLWTKGSQSYLPLYEAKMIQMYDHRAAGVFVKDENWMRQGQTTPTTLVQHQNPEFTTEPRWWVNEKEVANTFTGEKKEYFIGFKDITSSTNERTMIAAAIPWSAVTNHFPIIRLSQNIRSSMCLLANLNSFILDFTARQKIGGVTLNFFIVEQFPIFPPDFYQEKCPWNPRQSLEKWISDRVLKLSCTANDMIPLAEAAGMTPPVRKWKSAERLNLMAELDAAYFLLYGLTADDVRYILSTFSSTGHDANEIFSTGSTAERILKFYDDLNKRIQLISATESPKLR